MKEQKPTSVLAKYRGQRVRRTRLQNALIAKVPNGIIKLNKRVRSLTNLGVDESVWYLKVVKRLLLIWLLGEMGFDLYNPILLPVI